MSALWPRVRRRLVGTAVNNVLVNNVLVLAGQDDLVKRLSGGWEAKPCDPSRSLQENVGYSHHPDIERSLAAVRETLRDTARTYVPAGGRILDVGCGTGLFLRELRGYRLTGIDLNPSFLARAQEEVPEATLIAGDYMDLQLDQTFEMIYLIGVLQYLPPSRLRAFFEKSAASLAPGGVLVVNYAHALRWQDLLYPDLRYVRYSPPRLAAAASARFEILRHKHIVDEREVGAYDRQHYYFPDGTQTRTDTNLNTYMLVARRR